MKIIIFLLSIAFVGAGIIWGISSYLAPDDLKSCIASGPSQESDRCAKADAIVAISGGDTNARTNQAIELYKQGWADTLIFSGAAYDEDSPSNAEAMLKIALAAGVPRGAIEIEEYARDTAENAQRTLEVAEQKGVERIILVTSAYHQRRASMEFRQSFGDITVIDHPVPTDKDWSSTWWVTPRGWWLALSESAKILYATARGIV